MNQVGHLSQVAGKSMVTFIHGAQPASFWLADVMRKQIEMIIAEGDGWPDDAVYKVSVQYHTWPMGWDKETYVTHHATEEGLQQQLDELKEWALCEDNQVKVVVEEWDLGPNHHSSHHFG